MEGATANGTRHGAAGSPPVFISYARGASLEQARALREELSGREEQAFIDEKNLVLGGVFPRELADALLASRVVVLFASQEYFRRWYCLWELEIVLRPFRTLWPGAMDSEKQAALDPIVIALPPEGIAVPELSSLPPLLQNSNWPRAGETTRLAKLIREQLAATRETLGERLEARPKKPGQKPEAAGQAGRQLRAQLLEGKALRPPETLAGTSHHPRELPPSLGTSFVGREDDLWRIHYTLSVLQDQRGMGAAGAALTGAVQGAGGFGKTRLALEYLHRFGPSYYPGGLFWVNADVAEDRLEEQFHGILRTLKPEVPDLMTFREGNRNAAEEMSRALEEVATQERVLYVVDNVPETKSGEPPKPLRTWCPAMGTVSLLVTSRARVDLGKEGIHGLELSTLAPDAAVALLTEGINRRVLKASDWYRLAEWVGFLPLALELLNRTMQVGGLEPEELLSEMESLGLTQALDQRSEELQPYVQAGVYRGVTEAFRISYEKLSEPERNAARLVAWMAPEPIPLELLKALGPEVASSKVRGVLSSRHFVTHAQTDTVRMFGSMHRVLADYLRTQSPEPVMELGHVCEGLIKVMAPSASRDPSTWDLMDACRPHAECVFKRLTKDDTVSEVERALSLGSEIGFYLNAKGLVRQSRDTDERVVELASEYLGIEHPDTLTAMSNLAETLRAQGKLDGARERQERVLEVRKRALGEEHPETLKAMLNLAETLRAQGDLVRARQYQEQMLAVSRRVLGEEHPETLTAMNNLAGTLSEQGELGGARRYLGWVLKVRRRALGEEHPETLRAMNNLAGILSALGDLGGTRKYLEQVLAVSRRVLGEEHPIVLRTMNNLALTLSKQGDLGGARRYLEQVLAVSRRVLGEEHPETLRAMNNLAGTLSEQGDLGGALKYQERVLEVSRGVLGEAHPFMRTAMSNLTGTLAVMSNLATMLFARGELGEARKYEEQVLEVVRRVLGEEHPDTLAAMINLALTLSAQGEPGLPTREGAGCEGVHPLCP